MSETRVSRGHNTDDTPGKRRWRTMPELIAALVKEQGRPFDLDAAAEPGASVCERWLGPGGIEPDCLTADWSSVARRNETTPQAWSGVRVVWFNPPWGPRLVGEKACAPKCRRLVGPKKGTRHRHIAVDESDTPGTGDYVEAAIRNAGENLVVMMLLATAPDTAWWRAAFLASAEVRLLPRIPFVDADTGKVLASPPGCGVTLFRLWRRGISSPRVVLADRLGRPL